MNLQSGAPLTRVKPHNGALGMAELRPLWNAVEDPSRRRPRLQPSTLLVFTITLCICRTNLAEQTPPEETVGELVARLDAPQRAVRDQAEADLIRLGTQILPILNKFVPTSAEARLRWDRVRRHLVTQQIERESQGSLVTLTVTDVPVEKALQVISEQTGNRVHATGSLAQRTISCSYQNRPFWTVVEDLAQQVKGEVVPDAVGSLELVDEEKGRQRLGVTYSGPFRLALYAISPLAKNELKAGTAKPFSQIPARTVLAVELAWEPRLRPALVWWGPTHWQCEGTTVPNGSTASRREIPVVGPRCAVQVVMPAESPCPSAARRRLSGTVEPILPLGTYPFDFTKTDFDQGTAQRQLGEVKVQLRGWQKRDSHLQVALRAEFLQPQDAFGSHRGWFYHWRAELRTGTTSQPPDQVEAFWLGDNGVELIYHFHQAQENVDRVTWLVPVAIAKAPFDFEFDLAPER